MPRATQEEGTGLILDAEAIVDGTGFADVAPSDIMRLGPLVTVAMNVKNAARAAWAEKEKYALGTLTTEGGVTYVLILKEPEAEKAKPSADAGVHWEVVATPTVVCTLPVEYRPSATVTTEDGNFTISEAGVVKATYSLVAGATKVFQVSYRAAGISP